MDFSEPLINEDNSEGFGIYGLGVASISALACDKFGIPRVWQNDEAV